MRFFLTFGMLLLSSFGFAQGLGPRMHLVRGGEYYLTCVTASTSIRGLNGRENRLSLSDTLRMVFRVKAVQDTVYLVDFSYRSIQMQVTTADTTIKMNTVTPGKTDTASLILTNIINRPFELTMTATGRIKTLTQVDGAIITAVEHYPVSDTLKNHRLTVQLVQLLGESAIREILEQGLAVFPRSPVSKSGSWTVNTQMETPYPVRSKTMYRLFDASAKDYEVYGDGTLMSDTTAIASQHNGFTMKYNINGTTLSDIKIDGATGWINEVKARQILAGEIEISDAPKIPQPVTVPISYNAEITITGK